MKSVNAALYKDITPAERVSLSIAALARKDFEEAARLRDTCPWHEYRARDARFVADFSSVFVLALYAQTLVLSAEIQATCAFSALQSGREPLSLDQMNELLIAMMIAIKKANAVRLAWKECCRARGIDPRAASKATHLPLVEALEVGIYDGFNLGVDEEYKTFVTEIFKSGGYLDEAGK